MGGTKIVNTIAGLDKGMSTLSRALYISAGILKSPIEDLVNAVNISSKYLPKLRRKGAIQFVGKERRSTFYSVVPEMRWTKLKEIRTNNEEDFKKADKIFMETKITRFIEK